MEKVTLTTEEKQKLWSKLEYRKKKNAEETKNEVFDILNSAKNSDLTKETFTSILNSLEYSFKKSLKERTAKNCDELIAKLPKDWV